MSCTVEIPRQDLAHGFESDLEVRVAGESLILLHERALFWRQGECLIVSDLHWGRTAAFQAAAISPPRSAAGADLRRLGGVLERTGASRLVLLGQLITTPRGGNSQAFEALGRWRERFAEVQVFLVHGGRRLSAEPPAEWRIQRVREPWYWKPFAFRHVPAATQADYTWSGHFHPATATKGRGKGRQPCFLLGERVGILPAFGSFGGSMLVEAGAGDKVFAVGARAVRPV